MLDKHEGNGCLRKQLFHVGSAVIKMGHLQSHQQASRSGDNLSPRSVLEQCALSGLALALDLHNTKNQPRMQENVFICRFLSRERLHDILHLNPRTTSDGGFMVGRELSKQMLGHVAHDDEGLDPDNSDAGGLRIGASMHMCGEDGTHIRSSYTKLSSSSSPPMDIMSNSSNTCRSVPERAPGRGSFLHQDSKLSHSSLMEDSIFSYTLCNVVDDGDEDLATPPIGEDFLKLCFLCKCQLNMGKDIYMYRGDQAFCSAECRYQQIARDEGKGSSS